MSVHTSGPELESGARTAGTRPARRADIDGLRGLAIALVVIFHVWFGRVSGGVDVFLALSGFFFVGTLLRTADSSAPLDPRPVLRRIGRRLLPPLVVVLTAVAAATVVLRPFTQWLDVADQTGASLLFFQNWHLARTASDYLAADPMVSPLQHLWSIAVQGQFYIAALVVVFGLAWLLRRMSVPVRLPLTVLLAVLTAASLAYAVLADRPQSWLYYDSAARAWELTLGGLLMCLSPWLRVPRALRIVLGALGLAVLLACGFVLDGNSLFPGPWALVPVGAAMALVVAGIRSGSGSEHDTPSARLLASAPMVRLGAIAYALYLWHWPVLIGYLIVRGHPSVGLVGGLVVIALSLLLAEASTRWFEDPIRRVDPPRPSRTALVGLVTVLAVALVGAANLWHTHVDRSTEALDGIAALPTELYPGAAVFDPAVSTEAQPVQPPLLVAHRDLPPATLDNCIAQHTNRTPLTCTYGDPLATRRMVVVGGSHSEHWLAALDALGIEHGFRLDTYLKVGCPLSDPLAPLVEESPTVECDTWSTAVLAELRADPPDYVFTTSTRTKDQGEGPGDFVPFWYVDLWETLADYGIPVVAIRDNPWLFRGDVAYRAADCLAGGGTAETCGVPREEALDPIDPAVAASAHLPTVSLLDLSDKFCRQDLCRAVEGNILIYRDENHLTTTYVRTLTPELGRQLGPATGWW
ncbi:acyltransferase family protein [Rhodococcus rhodochrous]|uniref:acyltransferase family protein n=1 Tax=Rhodococcus rhodochrous TaxID=1829 RepID=UPI000D083430|nr:acyltransferase family protein [Rhodococcus rhodochrous]AYA26809.1 acyltransferase [Rhodococcus rhodochrous]MCD2096064.1 acyltransferase [Rhodococcus rhodochrous]MCD2120822.1 acyltransferase [Rhodococcus rhodochrous]MCQ4137515.1 acyltransferase [Rhodococcus rhodochrous]MDJ0017688.1 acyltransferase family protein [Rhodococcus rhodochrous]